MSLRLKTCATSASTLSDIHCEIGGRGKVVPVHSKQCFQYNLLEERSLFVFAFGGYAPARQREQDDSVQRALVAPYARSITDIA
eukprot:319766-Rhodomonas_salina.5